MAIRGAGIAFFVRSLHLRLFENGTGSVATPSRREPTRLNGGIQWWSSVICWIPTAGAVGVRGRIDFFAGFFRIFRSALQWRRPRRRPFGCRCRRCWGGGRSRRRLRGRGSFWGSWSFQPRGRAYVGQEEFGIDVDVVDLFALLFEAAARRVSRSHLLKSRTQ